VADAVEAMTDHDVELAALADLLASPLDPVLSDHTRLRIQVALHALPSGAAMSFTILRKTLMLTDGNLGMHVHVLMDAGFVSTEEHWRGKRRTTLYQATSAGRAALDAHIRALNAIIQASGS
jgi:DNA-binding MarR family transcriptional regulator